MLIDGDLGNLTPGDLLGAGPSWSAIAGWLCTIAVVAGYFMFYSSVKRLAGVIALVIRFAANAALAYYVSTL